MNREECRTINQWMALSPPKLVKDHWNVNQKTIDALRKDKPVIAAPRR
ncbi:MAG: hypothetical protein WA858_07400 [Xanthobacteraceae bacterium]